MFIDFNIHKWKPNKKSLIDLYSHYRLILELGKEMQIKAGFW